MGAWQLITGHSMMTFISLIPAWKLMEHLMRMTRRDTGQLQHSCIITYTSAECLNLLPAQLKRSACHPCEGLMDLIPLFHRLLREVICREKPGTAHNTVTGRQLAQPHNPNNARQDATGPSPDSLRPIGDGKACLITISSFSKDSWSCMRETQQAYDSGQASVEGTCAE
jgi:hypothetical protein